MKTNRISKHFIAVFFASFFLVSSASAALYQGSVAFVGFNFDDPDQFSFLLLDPVSATDTIKFTDSGWTNNNAFRVDGEGVLRWIPGSALSAGTVVTITGTSTASHGTVSQISGSFLLSATGDQILAYQGTQSSPFFVGALNSEDTGWQTTADNANTSTLPQGLINGVTAIALNEIDNSKYNCSTTTGNKHDLRIAINNPSNWAGSNTVRVILPPASCSFSVAPVIPTLSEWGLILMTLLLLCFGTAAIFNAQLEIAPSSVTRL